MHSEDFVFALFLMLADGLFFGMGLLIYVDMKNEQASRLACIDAGKSWIEKSCVKEAP